MKKLLTLVVGLLALTSISFAVSDNEIQAKKNQLLPLISLILNSNEYTEAQKNTVKAVISNCATSNKNEVIRGACGMITEEITTKEEIEIPPENNPKNRETINEKTILWCNGNHICIICTVSGYPFMGYDPERGLCRRYDNDEVLYGIQHPNPSPLPLRYYQTEYYHRTEGFDMLDYINNINKNYTNTGVSTVSTPETITEMTFTPSEEMKCWTPLYAQACTLKDKSCPETCKDIDYNSPTKEQSAYLSCGGDASCISCKMDSNYFRDPERSICRSY